MFNERENSNGVFLHGFLIAPLALHFCMQSLVRDTDGSFVFTRRGRGMANGGKLCHISETVKVLLLTSVSLGKQEAGHL